MFNFNQRMGETEYIDGDIISNSIIQQQYFSDRNFKFCKSSKQHYIILSDIFLPYH